MKHKENWKDVPGYEGIYKVSNMGRVKVLKRWAKWGGKRAGQGCWKKERILKPGVVESGHLCVRLCKPGKSRFVGVHRLVLEAFVGPCPEGMECRHFPDRDPANNRLENLQWGTHTENIRDRFYHGTDMKGEKNASAKLTEAEANLVRELANEDELKWRKIRSIRGRSYPYGRNVRLSDSLFERTGKRVTATMIGYIIRGDNWK